MTSCLLKIPRFGPLRLVASSQGLVRLQIGVRTRTSGDKTIPAHPWLRQATKELKEYFAGRRSTFTTPLDLTTGTPFMRKVWTALQQIPYGEVRSYGDIAQMAQRPNGARAIGLANHHNPLPIFIPCHRVILGNGQLGGYAPGIRYKRKLLQLEKHGCQL